MTRFFSLVAFAAAVGIAGSAQAREVSMKCTGLRDYAADAALCVGRAAVRFNSASPATLYAMRIRVPEAACSDISFVVHHSRPRFRHDAPDAIAYTYRLRPGQSQTVPIGSGFGQGANEVMLSGILYAGECSGRSAALWNAAVVITPVSS